MQQSLHSHQHCQLLLSNNLALVCNLRSRDYQSLKYFYKNKAAFDTKSIKKTISQTNRMSANTKTPKKVEEKILNKSIT
jgi:hypothetical protein